MRFKRKIEKSLETWKNNPERKPLVIMGARQVGKTTLRVRISPLNLETDDGFINIPIFYCDKI